MHFEFESSHAGGDFSSGRLNVAIRRRDDAAGVTTTDKIFFEVPIDFHTHHDSVAAALLTLVGNLATSVGFNFPISAQCAERLRAFYIRLERVGPIDPDAEPRRPGRRLALNFSGGIDSTAIWLVLQEALGGDFAVVTSEYGGGSAYEEAGYGRYFRDVSCRTDFRQKRFDRNGRFNGCVPLLFADYLDLGSLATGHVYTQDPPMVESLRSGRQPRFLEFDLAFTAGGLNELHIARMLGVLASLQILVTLGPERVEGAFAASSPPGSEKYLTNGMLVRRVFRRTSVAVPAFLEHLDPRVEWFPFGLRMETDMRLLQIAKWEGAGVARRICRRLNRLDLAIVDELSLNFLWRYHPSLIGLIPSGLRERVLAVYHRCGVLPFNEEDFLELERVRVFLAEAGVRYDPSPGTYSAA